MHLLLLFGSAGSWNAWRYSEDLSYPGYVATNATKDNATALVAAGISLKRLTGADFGARLVGDLPGQGLNLFVPGRQYIASGHVMAPIGLERLFWKSAVPGAGSAAPGASILDGTLRRYFWLFTATAAGAPSPVWFDAADGSPFDIRIGGFQLEPVAAGTKHGVAVIGDSTTHGLSGGGAGPGTDIQPNLEWPRWAEAYLSIPFFNRARDGDFTAHMIARWAADMTPLAATCKYALIAGGINDIASGQVSVATLKANLSTLAALAVADGMIPILTTITPGSFDADREANRRLVNEWIRSSYRAIDFAAVTQDPANPARTRNADDPSWFGPYPDGIHYGPRAKRAIGTYVAAWPGWDFVLPRPYQPVPVATPAGAPISIVEPRALVVPDWRGAVGGRIAR